MKTLSRLTALVLAMVLALGTIGTAWADEEFIHMDDYDALLNSAVYGFYQDLMATTDYNQVLEVLDRMTWDQFNDLVNIMTEEQASVLNAHTDALYEEAIANPEFYMVPPVNFTRAARFKPPVKGTASVTRLATRAATGTRLADAANFSTNKEIISGPDADGVYWLELEAWATGAKTVTSTESPKPTDIILVLDQSGSMDFCITCGKEDYNTNSQCTTVQTGTAVYPAANVTSGEYYIKNGDNYSRVYYCNGSNSCTAGWYTERHYSLGYYNSHSGTRVVPMTSADDTESGHVQFYTVTTTSVNHRSRLSALSSAVTSFVNSVYSKAAGADGNLSTTDDNVNHKIAVVGFASESGYGNNTEILSVTGTNSGRVGVAYNNLGDTHYKSALQDVSVAAGQTMVTNAVNALAANGATRSDLGMEIASEIFANNPIPEGEERSRVVIMFTDGSPTSQSNFSTSVAGAAISNAHALKHDYGATVYTVGVFAGADGTVPLADGASNENKYMHYTSSNFENATGWYSPGTATYPRSGSYYLSANDSASLSNIFVTISDQIETGGTEVTLDENTVVKDVISDQFELPAGADVSSIKVFTEDYTAADTFTNRQEFNANITLVNDGTRVTAVQVSNFDFAENWCGTVTTDGKVAYCGQKLIIQIPIVIRDGFLGGNGVYTNGAGSGVYENADAQMPVEEFVSPDVDVQIDPVTVQTIDHYVYLLDDLPVAAVEAGLTVKVGDIVLDMDATNYGLADWQTAYVTLDERAGWTRLVDDVLDYTATVTVSPTDATGAAQPQSGSDTGNIYVFKPVLTFKDSEVKYNTNITEAKADAYYAAKDYVGVEWQHPTATGRPSGAAPALTLAYAADYAWLNGQLVEGKVDANVNVTVTLGDTDVTNHSTSIRLACTCTNLDAKCTHEADTTAAAMGNKPEFVVHVYDVYGHLKITKTVVDEDTTDSVTPNEAQVFTFNVTIGSETKQITLKNGETYTFSDIAPGTSYTVTEVVPVGYEVTLPTTATGTIKAGKTAEVEVTNTFKVADLTIIKDIVGVDANCEDDVFTFQVQLGDNENPEKVDITGEGLATITDIPIGTQYIVTEINLPTGYKKTNDSSDQTGTIVEGTNEVTITNTYSTGSLTVSKTVVGVRADKTEEFTFTVNLPDGSYPYTKTNVTGTQTLTVTNGKATFQLKDSESVVISAIPVGAAYTVTETVDTAYSVAATVSTNDGTVTANVVTGTVDADGVTAAYTNTLKVGTLTIVKAAGANTSFEAGETFQFTISGLGLTVQIPGAGSIIIKDVPLGDYTVTENTAWSPRYTVDNDSKTVTVTEAGATVTFTNTLNNNQWLDGNTYAENTFNDNAKVTSTDED